MDNKGVAPLYFKWPIAVALADSRSNIGEESVQKLDSIDIRTWLPDRHTLKDHYSFSQKLIPGSYTLLVAILDEETNRPGIKLAIEGERSDGWTNVVALAVCG